MTVAAPPRNRTPRQTAKGGEDQPDYVVRIGPNKVELWAHKSLEPEEKGAFFHVQGPAAKKLKRRLDRLLEQRGVRSKLDEYLPQTARFTQDENTLYAEAKLIPCSSRDVLNDPLANFVSGLQDILQDFVHMQRARLLNAQPTPRQVAMDIAAEAAAEAYAVTFGKPADATPRIADLSRQLVDLWFTPEEFPHYDETDRRNLSLAVQYAAEETLGGTDELVQKCKQYGAELKDVMTGLLAQQSGPLSPADLPMLVRDAAETAYARVYQTPEEMVHALQDKLHERLVAMFPEAVGVPTGLKEAAQYMTEQFVECYAGGAARMAEIRTQFLDAAYMEACKQTEENIDLLKGSRRAGR